MKFLIPILMILFSIDSSASETRKKLFCSHPHGFAILVDVTVTDQENYLVTLMDQDSHPMPVYQSKLTFNERGEIQSITTSAIVELLELRLSEETWKGEYWFDNVRYLLTCKNRVH